MERYLIYLLLCSLISCQTSVENKVYNSGIHIIPEPLQLETQQGSFSFNHSTTLSLESNCWEEEACLLKDKLDNACGWKLSFSDHSTENSIRLKNDESLGEEGYKIEVNKNHISLFAATKSGMFYALQTFFQLFPAEIEGSISSKTKLSIPAVRITDNPRFGYRGVMIDVCRHFFTVEELKKQISVMAMLKLNRLHLHLTDNQGWRIAIDKYPQLVECSAVQETYNNELYGPYYYTKEDIKELVDYASRHHVEIIPEIEFPGHSLSALVPFPGLSCTGGPFKSEQVFGYEENVFCVGNDSVFVLMEDILREIAQLFPSQYIHIGGDECVKTHWKTCRRCQALAQKLNLRPTLEHTVEEQLQSYAIKRMEHFISVVLGKRMIGWEEILEGGLPEDATVMSWKGTESGSRAAATDHDVIMASMADGLYLCAAQGADEVEPAAMGGQAYLKDVYEFEPLPEELVSDKRRYVIGTQACLWSEWTPSVNLLEYMLYPRVIALAETAWSVPENRNWNDFLRRLENMQVRLDLKGINYHIPIPEGVLTTNKVFTGDSVILEFTNSRSLPMVYTLDGTTPDANSLSLPEKLVLRNSCTLKVGTKTEGDRLSPIRTIAVEKQKAIPSSKNECSEKIRLRLAKGLFKNDSEYAKARFYKDTVICSLSEYNKDKLDFKQPSLAVYSGEIEVPETGIYTFKSNADELWIAEKRLIYNPTSSRYCAQKTQIALEKGVHLFKLVFSNRLKEGFASSWYDIDFQYQLPSGEWVKGCQTQGNHSRSDKKVDSQLIYIDSKQQPKEEDRNINELYLNTTPQKKVILDVDMCTDVDDVCAVRMATALDDDGIIDLKGIAYSIVGKNNLEALRGFLIYENKPEVLIGKSSVDIPDESPYWDLMCEYNDGKVNAYDAVKMYRKILAQSDTYVDIITTGYATNVESLLKSNPDEYSELTGLELVKKKCGQLYVVGGTYPEGRCNNFFFAKEARTAIDYVSKNWPYPILFFTNEVGGRLTCGAQLQAVDKEKKDIVTRSLIAFGTQHGRNAWDPFGVWCAGYACGEINKIGFKRVNLEINVETGYNKFTDAANGKHFVIYRLCDDDNYYNSMMDKLLIKKAKM